jgi:hypothetical protein
VSPSGLIYATIVVLWAAVLVPMWLRRHDEVTESRSVDRFQGAMRTLSRRAPAGDRREVLVPRRGETHAVPDNAFEPPTPASLAAARRRRVGLVMLGIAVVVGILGAMHVLPMWSPLVPLALLMAFLLRARVAAHRVQARELADRRARAAESRRLRHEQAARTMSRDEYAYVPAPRAARTPTFVDPAVVGRSTEIRRTPAAPAYVAPEVAYPAEPAAAAVAADPAFYDAIAARAWDPVPVPVPTYVSAPKAPRSVRIVDLTKPGAWTSGRLPNAPLPDDAEAAEAARRAGADDRDGIVTGEVLVERRRAVGD